MAKVKLELLSIGNNRKIGKKIGIFNLPQGITCPGKTELCRKLCYARKAERMYPAASNMRMRNLARTKTDTFVQDMIKEIKVSGIKKMRWHESGDVYSADYARKIISIVQTCPEVNFLMYSKSFMFKDIFVDKPDNLSLYWSIDNTTKGEVPAGHTCRLLLHNEIPIPEEATCIHTSSKHYCGTECTTCWEGKVNTYLDEH